MKEIKDIRDVQKISLNLLNVFDSFCEKNDLHYYLAFGTLLGAIRHKGFIPWDDDIDLMMERADFDRLVNLHQDRHRMFDFIHIRTPVCMKIRTLEFQMKTLRLIF